MSPPDPNVAQSTTDPTGPCTIQPIPQPGPWSDTRVLLIDGDADTRDDLQTVGSSLREIHAGALSEEAARAILAVNPRAPVVMNVTPATLGIASTLSAMMALESDPTRPALFIASDQATYGALPDLLTGLCECALKPVPPHQLGAKLRIFSVLRRQREALRDLEQQTSREVELAARLQSRFIPKIMPTNEHVAFSLYHETCAKIGGDLQDIFELGRGRFGFYIVDVAGHGVSAAMLSGSVKMSFESLKEHMDLSKLPVSELLDPGVMLTRINAAFHETLPPECFISIMYGVIDPRNRILRISNAGHPFPMLFNGRTSDVSPLKFPSGPALGPVKNAYFPMRTLELGAGDKLLFYTDGLTEAVNPAGVEFGEERLLKMLRVCGPTSSEQLKSTIAYELEQYRAGRPMEDDCSFLVIQLR